MPEIQKGELTVSGEGEHVIVLERRPHRVHILFLDDHNPAPCNPHHHDKLRHEVREIDEPHRHLSKHWILEIWWSVAGVRTVEYVVEY
jgi:hypothetical protein